MIRYHCFATKAEASVAIASSLAQTILSNRKVRLGLATGRTMIPIYASLIQALTTAKAELYNLVTYNLDEWGFAGTKLLDRKDIRTFAGFMDKHLFHPLMPLHFDLRNAHFPSDHVSSSVILKAGMDLSAYDDQIFADGGVDTWLIGAGAASTEHPYDAHAAFMERTHLLHLGENWHSQASYSAMLEQDTIRNNMDYEGCHNDPTQVPNLAMTVGTATLVKNVRRRAILAAFGPTKSGSLLGACELPPHAGCSASIIQVLSARGIDVDVYMDTESSSLLTMKNRFV